VSHIANIDDGASHELGMMITCRNIGEVLAKKYRDYTWMVQPYADGSAYQIYCVNLSGKWGFVIHANKIDNDYKAVIRAGGEILERFNLSRVKLNKEKALEIPRIFTGEKVFDNG
jgi:hypothetical protein